MKLLNLAMAAATVCGLVSAVPGGSTSPGKPRRRCSRRPHSLATSKTGPYHGSSTTTSTTVIINTTSTSTQSTTATSVSTTAPPDTTTTTAPPDTTTTTAPPDTTTTTAPPDTTTTTAPPDTTTAPATTTTAPPPVQTCELGTSFGYRAPVNGVVQAPQLDTFPAATCNRWGWYTTPSLADLQSGVTGQLLVGAGNNNINAATNVGIYVATSTALGSVTVSYQLNAPYVLTEVHVDLRCLPITDCAPGGYTYVQDPIPELPTWSTTPLSYPTCSGGSVPYLIVHASVVELTTGVCSD